MLLSLLGRAARSLLRLLGRQRWFWVVLIGSVCGLLRALALALRWRRAWWDRRVRRALRRRGVRLEGVRL